ncbi:MAG: S9 family peptidase [Xanthobacteraceae bacterium]
MLETNGSHNPEPSAEPRPSESTWHGITLVDEFAWLRAANWQEVMRDPEKLDPAIRGYLAAENEYCNRILADTVPLEASLFDEMKGRLKQDDATVPRVDGPHAYYTRYRLGGQHPLVCRQPREGGSEELLLDGDAVAKTKAYFHLGATRHSPDHRWLAWASDDAGSEFYTARVRDLKTGADLEDAIADVSGSVAWTLDGQAFYYVRLDRNHRPVGVFRHRLGTAAAQDVCVLTEREPRYFISLSDLQAGRFAEISIHDHETSECWLIDLAHGDGVPRLVAARESGVRYSVEHHPGLLGAPSLIILTNADGAEDFKIISTPLDTSERSAWRDLIPHCQGVFVLSFSLLAHWLVRLERENGLPRIVVRNLRSGEEHSIGFAKEAYSLGMEGGFEFATDNLRFAYSSMTTPSEVWDYDLSDRRRRLRKRQEIPSGHDPANYVTRRLLAPLADGETVPISILHHKDLARDGSAACLLYGYGAYGLSIPAAFSANRLSLADRGFVFAVAHVRGGTEKGWRWYREGKLADKHNTFTDFIAAAEYLVHGRWAARTKLVAQGGSAGGLLIGAVANMRPDLFAGMIAEVPFVDVLNTMLDETLPLTPPEWPEWGNPIADAEAFRTILAYSPYENVQAQDYPAMLVLAGLTDPRVTYWEPAKWVARLRRLRTNHATLALRTNLEAGHAGASGRFDRLKEVALAYAFAIKVTGGSLEPGPIKSPL